MTDQLKNKNEFRENGNLYIRELRRCSCVRKEKDEYTLYCWVHQRGKDYYSFRKEDKWITKKNSAGRKLWLGEDAMNTVLKAIDAFDAESADPHAYAFDVLNLTDCELFQIFYRPAEDNRKVDFTERFDFILRYRRYDASEGKKTITERKNNITWKEILRNLRLHIRREDTREIIQTPTPETISQHPLAAAAQKAGLVQLEKIIRLFYHLEDREDCRILAEMTGHRILPPLPKEYNHDYTVVAASMTGNDYRLLKISGYELLHRPYFGMKGLTHTKILLNPHTKYGLDAAGIEKPAITFGEFLKLFDNE